MGFSPWLSLFTHCHLIERDHGLSHSVPKVSDKSGRNLMSHYFYMSMLTPEEDKSGDLQSSGWQSLLLVAGINVTWCLLWWFASLEKRIVIPDITKQHKLCWHIRNTCLMEWGEGVKSKIMLWWYLILLHNSIPHTETWKWTGGVGLSCAMNWIYGEYKTYFTFCL